MEHLTKHQLILVALLISFVTSLATGIVTVSLMDQSPHGVIQTINRVVETVSSTPQNAAVNQAGSASASAADPLAAAVATVSGSIVRIRPAGAEGSSAAPVLGLLVSAEGAIIADKLSLGTGSEYVAVLSGGREIPVHIVRSQIGGDIAFLAPIEEQDASKARFTPAAIAESVSLGQTVAALSGTSTLQLAHGLISEAPAFSAEISLASSTPFVRADLSGSLVPGAPLFNVKGKVIGIRTSSSAAAPQASFYPLNGVRAAIPEL